MDAFIRSMDAALRAVMRITYLPLILHTTHARLPAPSAVNHPHTDERMDCGMHLGVHTAAYFPAGLRA